MLTRLALVLLACSAAAAQAQPAVPAVPPLRNSRPATAAPAAQLAPGPAPSLDAPPTSDAPTSGAPVAAAKAPNLDAPPTSDAAPTSTPPTTLASAAPTTAPAAAAPASAQPALPPTVTKNYPLTPEGNARFLAEYAARPDVKKLEDGVLYRVLKPADAKDPKSIGPIARGDVVTVSYRGWLIDGKLFDETKPDVPTVFSLNGVVAGWRTALMKMKVGDLWEVAIPGDQAYGAEGRPGRIPPNQALIFVISLAKVEYAG